MRFPPIELYMKKLKNDVESRELSGSVTNCTAKVGKQGKTGKFTHNLMLVYPVYPG